MLNFAKPLVENYGFVAVIPKGLKNSFNAQVCCGYAMQNKVDDIGFLRRIRDRLPSAMPVTGMVSRELTFAVGWSNGAYLATLDAVQSPTNRVFAAVVPISGFQPIPAEGIAPVPMFMHHSRDDSLVRFGGCCGDPGKKRCCCGISELSPRECTSTREYFQKMARLNNCNVEEEIVTFNRTNARNRFASSDVVCFGYPRCQQNVTFCEYEDYGHFNRKTFHNTFPVWMRDEVGRFIANAEGFDSVTVGIELAGYEPVQHPATYSTGVTAVVSLVALLLIITFMLRNLRTHRRAPYAMVHQAD